METFEESQFAEERPKSPISSLQTIVLFSVGQMWMREKESLKSWWIMRVCRDKN